MGGEVGNVLDVVLPGSRGLATGSGLKSAESPESANALAGIAMQLLSETAPVREGLINQSTGFLEGGFDPTSTPSYDFARQNINMETDKTRQNILSSLPSGGALQQGLTDLEINRGNALTQAGSDIYNQQLNQAFQTAFGAPLSNSTASLGSAAQMQTQLAAQNAKNTNQKIGGTKAGIGYGLGAGL